jgi:AcrR family transcriptional regulator
MGRWEDGTRARLQAAAVALFERQGYGDTTTQEIAAAAGVTQRTFFRHFADKEEVLFGQDDELLSALLAGARGTDPSAAPAAVVRAGLLGLAGTLHPAREKLRLRAAVLRSDAALVGRDLAKQAGWTSALAGVLEERGVAADAARALAGTGAAAFRAAYEEWLADRRPLGLAERFDRVLAQVVRDLSALPGG